MSTHHPSGSISTTPVHRCCALCGQAKTVYPPNEDHRRAHLARQLAFVCDDCAGRVRSEVEAAAQVALEPEQCSA